MAKDGNKSEEMEIVLQKDYYKERGTYIDVYADAQKDARVKSKKRKRHIKHFSDYQHAAKTSKMKQAEKEGKPLSNETGKIKKKNRGSDFPSVYDADGEKMKPVALQMMPIMMLPRCRTDAELIDRFDWLVNYILEEGLQPSLEVFGLAFDVDGRTIREWGHGVSGELRSSLVKKYKLFAQSVMYQSVANGDLNPIVWMFYGKNWFGYSDKRNPDEEQLALSNEDLSTEQRQAIVDAVPTEVIDIDVK